MPLVYLGTGWFIGIALASALRLPLELLLPAILIPVVGFFLWRADHRARLIWLSVLFAISGAIWFTLRLPRFDQNSLATYNGIGEVTIDGVIAADPDVRDTYINLRVNADRLTLPDRSSRPIEGTVLVRPSRPAEFHYGDRVRVTGALIAPPEFATFDYADFLARQGVYSLIDRPRLSVLARDQGNPLLAAIYAFRGRARAVIAQLLPEPPASLLTGILLGDDAGLPPSVQDEFRRTGTTHIIAISGYNITVLVGLISTITFGLMGRRRAFYVIVAGLFAYAVLVGGSASVVRATLMGVLMLWADHLGRPYAAPNSLFAAGLIMTALDPNTLFDVGFQLSFVATLGLMIYARPFAQAAQRGLTRLFSSAVARQVVGLINDALLVTLAAQVITLPLLVYYFRQLSVVSLIVNPLVLPAQTGVMVFGLLALGGGLLFVPLGQVLAWLVWPFLAWTLGVIHVFAGVPGAAVELGYVAEYWLIVYYVLLAAVTWYLSRPPAQRPNRVSALFTRQRVVFGSGLGAILLGVALSWQGDGRLHVAALDVDGHPMLVRTPSGRQILIGGSSSPSALLSALGGQLPFWERDIDLMIVPTARADQLNSLLAVLDRYKIGQIMAADIGSDNRAGREWQATLSRQGKTPVKLQAADIEPGVRVWFDNETPIIDAGDVTLAAGISDRAQINLIGQLADRLPERPQMILTWTPVISDARVIDLTDHGTIDLTVSAGTVSIRAER